MEKLNADVPTGSFCEKPNLESRSAAACSQVLDKCQLNSTGKKVNIFIS
jgi:hypothetical protein